MIDQPNNRPAEDRAPEYAYKSEGVWVETASFAGKTVYVAAKKSVAASPVATQAQPTETLLREAVTAPPPLPTVEVVASTGFDLAVADVEGYERSVDEMAMAIRRGSCYHRFRQVGFPEYREIVASDLKAMLRIPTTCLQYVSSLLLSAHQAR